MHVFVWLLAVLCILALKVKSDMLSNIISGAGIVESEQ